MTRTPLALSLALTVLAAAAPAEAQTVTVTLGPQAAQAAQKLGITQAQLQALVRKQVGALYALGDVKDFLRLSANAASLSNKGLAVDYGSTFDRVIFGIGVNAAVATGESSLGSAIDTMSAVAGGSYERAVPVGAGAQLSLLAGVRVADGLYVFANGLAYPVSAGSFSGSGYNVGAHVQYRVFEGTGAKTLAEWGGLAFTSGLELSRAQLRLSDTLDAPAPLAQGFDVLTSSKGTATLTEEALTLPLELTTSVRLLYFLTLFGGLGADLQLGSASFDLNVTSTLTGVASTRQQYALGTAKAVYAGDNGADDVLLRALAGLELNLGPVHLYSQASVLTKDASLGVAAGLRVGF